MEISALATGGLGLGARQQRGYAAARRIRGRRIRARRNALHRHRLDHHRVVRHDEFEPKSIAVLEFVAYRRDALRPGRWRQYTGQSRIGACIADMNARDALEYIPGQPLRLEFRGGLVQEALGQGRRRAQALEIQLAFERRFAHRNLIGQPHAIGGQHAGEGMNEDP